MPKWIKASERLPEGTNGYAKQVVIKFLFHQWNNQLRVTTINEFLDIIKTMVDVSKVEWLDESPSDDKAGDAVGFAEWILGCDYRLSPHTVETTWIHKDLIGITHRPVLPSEGITTSELYEIYQQSLPAASRQDDKAGELAEALELYFALAKKSETIQHFDQLLSDNNWHIKAQTALNNYKK